MKLRGIFVLACVAPVLAVASSDVNPTSSPDTGVSKSTLLKQVKSNKTLRAQYMRHFGMTEQQLEKFLDSLKLDSLKSDSKLAVASGILDGGSAYHRQLVPKGTFVFVDPSGNPALIAKSGQPLFADGLPLSEAHVVDPEALGYYLIPADSIAIPATPLDLPYDPVPVEVMVARDAQGSLNPLPESSIGLLSKGTSAVSAVVDNGQSALPAEASSVDFTQVTVSPTDQEENLDASQDPSDSTSQDDSNRKDKAALVAAPVDAFSAGPGVSFLSELPWIGGSLAYGIIASNNHGGGTAPTPAPEPVTILLVAAGSAALLKRRARN